jgi:hypothetical protein
MMSGVSHARYAYLRYFQTGAESLQRRGDDIKIDASAVKN